MPTPEVTPASADAPRWGPIEVISPDKYSELGGTHVEVAVRDRLATAAWQAKAPGRPRGLLLKVSSRHPSGGRWGPAKMLAEFQSWSLGGLESLAVGPQGMVAVVWRQGIERSQQLFERHRIGGVWSTAHLLGQGADGSAVIDEQGVITVAWRGLGADSNVKVVSSNADGCWGAVQELADTPGSGLEQNRRGDLALSWITETGARTSLRQHDQPYWDLTPPLTSAVDPGIVDIALDERGRALLIWAQYSEDEVEPARKHLAWSQRNPGGPWSKPQYLDRDVKGAVEYMDLAMNARGEAVLVWGQAADASAARFRFNEGWTPPARFPNRGGWPTSLVTETGDAMVLFGDGRWGYQQPGGRWSIGGPPGGPPDNTGYLSESATDAAGDRIALVGYGKRLTARFLIAPRSNDSKR